MLRKLILYGAVVLFAAIGSRATDYAIVVGVGDYPVNSGLHPLAADKDASLIGTALRNLGWHVTQLMATELDSSRKPDQNNILRILGIQLDATKKTIKPERTADRFTGDRDLTSSDKVLFYFGGHGVTDQNDQDNLVPLDTVFANGRISNPDKLIQLRWIRDALRATKAGKIVLIVDACREGAETKSPQPFGVRSVITDAPPMATIAPPEDQQLLIFKSTGIQKWAYEIQTEGMGVFSYFIWRALTDQNVQREANRRGDGNFSLRDMVEWVRPQTSNFVASLPSTSKKGPQNPWIEGDEELDFVLAKFDVSPPPPPPPPPPQGFSVVIQNFQQTFIALPQYLREPSTIEMSIPALNFSYTFDLFGEWIPQTLILPRGDYPVQFIPDIGTLYQGRIKNPCATILHVEGPAFYQPKFDFKVGEANRVFFSKCKLEKKSK